MGVPHVVDFGKNMQYSPDGKAYLVGHGATGSNPEPRPANLSWGTGDQIYMARVQPSIQNINDAATYEFGLPFRCRLADQVCRSQHSKGIAALRTLSPPVARITFQRFVELVLALDVLAHLSAEHAQLGAREFGATMELEIATAGPNSSDLLKRQLAVSEMQAGDNAKALAGLRDLVKRDPNNSALTGAMIASAIVWPIFFAASILPPAFTPKVFSVVEADASVCAFSSSMSCA